MEGDAVKERWREYFDILLNEENPFTVNLPITTAVDDPQSGISIVEVKAAISKMKRGKAAGPDEITLEMALALEEEGIIWLYRVMDAIWKEKKLEVVQMRCLLTMRGVTRRERMRNEVIRQELKMAELREKIRKCIRNTRWYGHVKRMEENEFVSWSAERR